MKNFIEIQTTLAGKVTLNVNYIISVSSENKTLPKVFGAVREEDIPERVVRVTYISMSDGNEYETETPYETIVSAIDQAMG
mgnify:CR=1 FL=1